MDLLTRQYEKLDEEAPCTAIGEIIGMGDSRLVPFLCAGHRYLASYSPLVSHGEDVAASIRGIVFHDTQHVVSESAQLLKFAHYDFFFGGQRFEPAPAGRSLRRQMMFRIPERIAHATMKFMDFDKQVDEFYFIAGGETDDRLRQLDLWYQRISDRFDFQALGLTHIHQANGCWYGYRKIQR